MKAVTAFLQSIRASFVSLDSQSLTQPLQLFVVLVLIIVFLYGISVGKTRALLSLLAVYVALAITALFPYFEKLAGLLPETLEAYGVKALFFLAAYLITYILLNHSSLRNRLSTAEVSFGKVFIISLFQVGFIAASLASFVPPEMGKKFTGELYPFLGTHEALFYWALASLALVPFMRGHRRE